MRHLIIGNSAAGISAAEAIRRADPSARITILSDEDYPFYSRCLATYFLAGDRGEQDLLLREPGYYEKMRFDFRPREKVVKIVPDRKEVLTIAGNTYTYDRLLIATGAAPQAPYVRGDMECRAVFSGLRTLNDAKAMLRYAAKGKKAVVAGAGQVSLKMAYGLSRRGMEVTVLSTSPQILSQSLDEYAAGLVENHLSSRGIRFQKSTDLEEIVSTGGLPCAVRTTDGRELEADLVVFGKGVRPNVDCLRESGINFDSGVLVDRYLATNIPDIYAAGDCIESFDLARRCLRVNAIWPNATEQGRIAGLNMAGRPTPYAGSLAMNSMELFGYSVIAAGFARGGEPEYEVYTQKDVFGNYRRLVFAGDVLVGFILAGETKNAGLLTALIREGRRLGAKKDRLLGSRKVFYALFYEHRRQAPAAT